jgi:hypothetical protein
MFMEEPATSYHVRHRVIDAVIDAYTGHVLTRTYDGHKYAQELGLITTPEVFNKKGEMTVTLTGAGVAYMQALLDVKLPILVPVPVPVKSRTRARVRNKAN